MSAAIAFRARPIEALVSIVLALSCCGCSSTFVLDVHDDFQLETTNHQIRDRWGRLETSDGRSFAGTEWYVQSDSTRWRERNTYALRTIPTSEVRELVLKRHCRGARDGIVGLGLAGLALGVGAGLAADPGMLDRASAVFVLGTLGALTGAATGMVGGFFIGHSDHYLLNPPDLSKVPPAAPGRPSRSSAST